VQEGRGVIAQCPPVGLQVGVVVSGHGQVEQVGQGACRLPGAVQSQGEITEDQHVIGKQAVCPFEGGDCFVEALQIAQRAAVAGQPATQFGAGETGRERLLVERRGQVWLASVVVSASGVRSVWTDRAAGFPGRVGGPLVGRHLAGLVAQPADRVLEDG
jgi:hypothetical protein